MLLALGQLADPRILRLLAKTVAVTLLLFAALGTLGWFALDWAIGRAGLTERGIAAVEGESGSERGRGRNLDPYRTTAS